MTKLDRYFAAVAAIRARGTSTGSWVTVARAEDGDLDVQIRAGMLQRLNADAIAEEIRTALLAAVADHRRQYVQLRVDYFGSPVGVAAVDPHGTTDTTGPS